MCIVLEKCGNITHFREVDALLQKILKEAELIRRPAAAFAALTLSAALLTACGGIAGAAEPVSRDEYCLDTICTVSIYRMEDADGEVKPAAKMKDEAEKAMDMAFEYCRETEDLVSRTRKDSEISRLNSAGGEWVGVSDDTLKLIEKGLYYSELSGGGFDITVGGITKQWDFHAAEGEAKLPDEKELAKEAEHVGWRNVEIDGNRVRLKDPETEIDLGGIAKGYIGDGMSVILEDAGVKSGTVNLGGNVICIGGKTDEDDFVIGVETPFSDRTEIIGKIKARNKTLVTSGVYERRIEVDGKTYHHILDTETGWPVDTDLDAVTLVADIRHSADADALSTICLIKGAEEGKKLIESIDDVEGVFVLSDGSIVTTDGAGFESE